MNFLKKFSKIKVLIYNKEDLSMKKINKYFILLILLLSLTAFTYGGYVVGRVAKIVNLNYFEQEVLVVDLYKDDFSEEKFAKLLKDLNIKYPEVVMAQARLESQRYSSNIFIQNHNLFGMKKPNKRITTAKGTRFKHAYYDHWRESVYDYAFYQATYLKRAKTRQEYLNILSQSYAEDPLYISKLNNVIEKHNLKRFF